MYTEALCRSQCCAVVLCYKLCSIFIRKLFAEAIAVLFGCVTILQYIPKLFAEAIAVLSCCVTILYYVYTNTLCRSRCCVVVVLLLSRSSTQRNKRFSDTCWLQLFFLTPQRALVLESCATRQITIPTTTATSRENNSSNNNDDDDESPIKSNKHNN